MKKSSEPSYVPPEPGGSDGTHHHDDHAGDHAGDHASERDGHASGEGRELSAAEQRKYEHHPRATPHPDQYTEKGVPPGSDLSRLPINPHTGEPLPARAQPGYYPGYSTLSQQAFWDEATRNVVLARVNRVPQIRFFTPDEAKLMEAICARILPQDDRDEAHRIPIVDYIDDRLYNGRIDGYRFEGMPPDKEVQRLGLKAIEAIALHVYGKSFVDLDAHDQDYVLETIHDGQPPAGHEYWQQMSVRHFWLLLVQDVVEAYYAHPFAWDEIGFGGPAYPRGYMRLHGGEPEPYEKDERRYEWEAPPSALSDEYTYVGLEDPLEGQLSGKSNVPGQEGTH